MGLLHARYARINPLSLCVHEQAHYRGQCFYVEHFSYLGALSAKFTTILTGQYRRPHKSGRDSVHKGWTDDGMRKRGDAVENSDTRTNSVMHIEKSTQKGRENKDTYGTDVTTAQEHDCACIVKHD